MVETTFLDYLTARRPHRVGVGGRLLAIDPGETVGYALFEEGELATAGQFKVENILQLGVDLIWAHSPNTIVTESYRVYRHKLERHAWSNVPTLRYIGAIQFIVAQAGGITYHEQSAYEAKQFCTDDRLRAWGLWQSGNARHAHDAIRHACHFYLFGD